MMTGRHSSWAIALLTLCGAATLASAQSTGGNNPTQGGSTSTVLLALAINAGIAAAEVGVFLILRPRFPKVRRDVLFHPRVPTH